MELTVEFQQPVPTNPTNQVIQVNQTNQTEPIKLSLAKPIFLNYQKSISSNISFLLKIFIFLLEAATDIEFFPILSSTNYLEIIINVNPAIYNSNIKFSNGFVPEGAFANSFQT